MNLTEELRAGKFEQCHLRKESLGALWPISEVVGVIFLGGHGMRMKDVTMGIQHKSTLLYKPSKALVDNPVLTMRQAGVSTIYLLGDNPNFNSVWHHTREQRESYDGINYVVDDAPLGTLKALQNLIRDRSIQRPIITAYSDEVFKFLDLRAMYAQHARHPNSLTVFATDQYLNHDQDIQRWFQFNQEGQINNLQGMPIPSKDSAPFIGTGTWIISPEQFSNLFQARSWNDFLQQTRRRQHLYWFASHTPLVNVNTPADLALARKIM